MQEGYNKTLKHLAELFIHNFETFKVGYCRAAAIYSLPTAVVQCMPRHVPACLSQLSDQRGSTPR